VKVTKKALADEMN